MPSLSLKTDLADRIAFLDPHGGDSGGEGTARAAIVVCAFDSIDRIFVLDAWAKRCDEDELTKQVFEMNRLWVPNTFGIEDYGQQKLYIRAISREARSNGILIPIAEWHPVGKTEKRYRDKVAIQTPLAQHRLFIRRGLPELRSELAAFPQKSATVDLVDALASCILMHPMRATIEEQRAAVEDFRTSLLEQGLSEEYINKRISEEFGPQYAQED